MSEPTSSFQNMLRVAKTHIHDDPDLAVYMMRDYAETKAAGLDDLAWALARAGTSVGDAEYFFKQLEARLAEGETDDEN